MRTTISIDDSTVLVATENEGVKRVKSISPQDLVSLMCREKPLDSGILPRDCMRYISIPTATTYHIWVPPHKGFIKLHSDSGAIEVPFPPVFLVLKYAPDLASSKVFCTLPEFRTGRDINLYHFPYGNVNPDGEICWGSVIRDRRKERGSIETVVEQMLSSSYNSDLGRYIEGFNRDDYSEIDTYITEEMTKMNEFPANHLVYYTQFIVNATGDPVHRGVDIDVNF